LPAGSVISAWHCPAPLDTKTRSDAPVVGSANGAAIAGSVADRKLKARLAGLRALMATLFPARDVGREGDPAREEDGQCQRRAMRRHVNGHLTGAPKGQAPIDR
jgi:hypothetical protein